METTVFTVDFELVVDQPGLDVRNLINVAGQPSNLVSNADGVTFRGCAAVEASKSAEAQQALRERFEAGAAAAGVAVVSLQTGGVRATTFNR